MYTSITDFLHDQRLMSNPDRFIYESSMRVRTKVEYDVLFVGHLAQYDPLNRI
jgi:hypothetical protein